MILRFILIFYFFISLQAIKGQNIKLGLPLGHTEEVNAASFSPDGKYVLTCGDITARLWEVSTGRLLKTYRELTDDEILTATFSPDGKYIVTGSDDETVKIWDIQTGEIIRKLSGHEQSITFARFTRDGLKLITSDDLTIRVWEVATGKQLLVLNKNKEEDIEDFDGIVQLSPDERYILTITKHKQFMLWDLSNGKVVKKFNPFEYNVDRAVFSADGKAIYLNKYEQVERFDLQTSIKTTIVRDTDIQKIHCIKINRNGKLLAVACKLYVNGEKSKKQHIRIYDLETNRVLSDLAGHTDEITTLGFSKDDHYLVSGSNDQSAIIWDIKKGVNVKSLSANFYSKPSFSKDGKFILSGSEDDYVRVWETSTGKLITNFSIDLFIANKGAANFNKGSANLRSATFSDDHQSVLTSSYNGVQLWDCANKKLIKEYRASSYFNGNAFFSNDQKYVYTRCWDTVFVLDASSGNPVFTYKGQRFLINQDQFSPDGKKLVMTIDSAIRIFDIATGKTEHSYKYDHICQNARMSPDGKQLLIDFNKGPVVLTDLNTGSIIQRFDCWSQHFIDNGRKVIGLSNNQIKIFDAFSGNLIRTFEKSPHILTEITPGPDGKLLLAEFEGGAFSVWNMETGRELFETYVTGPDETVVLTPDGLFDASPAAMDKMYWVKGLETIELAQLKNRYWQPGLWQQIMSNKTLRSVQGMNDLKLQPLVELSSAPGNDVYIKLIKRDGGYGRVTVYVNNKEVIADARPAGFDSSKAVQLIQVNLSRWLVSGLENNIRVVARSADEFLSSRGFELIKNKDGNSNVQQPAFYAVICGTSEFSNPSIRLKYAVQDARSMEKAIRLGAENLFGKDSTHIYLLTSPGDTKTSKDNIRKAFEAIRARSKPSDILMVYLSGHGITWGGENGDFYYLTSDAYTSSSDGYNDPMVRKTQAISTAELVDMIVSIPALKQVMMIDACGSGKAVENLVARRDLDPSQVIALDRMKDRTGMFIISGCAADAVSYEASRFGQGLLTYSLLSAMKGAALKDNRYIDIATLLSYARDQVPRMAKDIGGIQQPQLLFPKAGSFDIGIINESDKPKIDLAKIKPVFVRTTLLEDTKKRDVLKLSQAINEKLDLVSGRGSGNNIVYIDADDYPDACSISGVYTQEGDIVNVSATMLCGTRETPIRLSGLSKEGMADAIVEFVLKHTE